MLIGLSIMSSFLIVTSQVLFKVAIAELSLISVIDILSLIANPCIYACLISFIAGNVLWWMIIGKYDFSLAYPLVSLNYLFAVIYSIALFKEPTSVKIVIGMILIIVGIVFVTSQFSDKTNIDRDA